MLANEFYVKLLITIAQPAVSPSLRLTNRLRETGEADWDIGSGVHIFGYELIDGTELLLSFAFLDDLQAAYRYDPVKDTREAILGPE